MVNTRCSAAWLAKSVSPFPQYSYGFKIFMKMDPFAASVYLKLAKKHSLLCTYLNLPLTAHKYSCSLQKWSLVHEIPFYTDTLCRNGSASKTRTEQTNESNGPLNIVSYAACFVTPSMTFSSPFSCTEFLRCHWRLSSWFYSTRWLWLHRYLTFVVYAFYFSIWLWILSIYDKRVKECTDKCVF